MVSRRTILLGILALTSAPEIPAIAAPAGVSPRMAEIIAEYKRTMAALDALNPKTAPDAWDAAEDAFEAAQGALLDARPVSAADFAAKFDALLDLETAEGEFVILKQLSADAHSLAGGE
jgi:hypothetical protein